MILALTSPSPARGQDAGTGTWDDPHRVEMFPYAHESDTTTGVEVADYYLCADWLDESGPEVVYAVELDRPGRITAWVAGDEEGVVDVDVHILDSDLVIDGETDCLHRGHTVAEALLPAGPAWVVVDTFVDGGEPLAGPYVLRIDFASYAEVDEGDPQVLVIERQIAQGVLWRQEVHDDLFGGVQTVNLLEVDLTHDEVVVEPRLSEEGCERPGEIAEREGAVAAINAGFFDSSCAPVGLVRIDDRFIASNPASRPPRAALGLGDDALALVEHVAPGDPFDEVRHALGGLPLLVSDAVADVTWSEEGAGESFTTSRHPRSAACITGDDYLLLVTFDGRTTAGLGVDLFDLADFLVSLGCDRGLNYDGGGSTVLWVTPTVGAGVVSYPSDNGVADHRGQRAVSNAWLVWAAPANRRPRFLTEPPVAATAGEPFAYDAHATDLDLDPIVYSILAAPEGVDIDGSTGEVTWTPTTDQGGPQVVAIGASDLTALTEQRFTVDVAGGDFDAGSDASADSGRSDARPDGAADGGEPAAAGSEGGCDCAVAAPGQRRRSWTGLFLD